MIKKVSAVYKITNTATGDFYIGSSKDVKQRWTQHKCKYIWNRCPNNPMYQDFQKYGTDKFEFEILEKVEPEHLKEREQQFIEKLKPIYNSIRANGWDFERIKKTQKKYNKEYMKKYYNQLCYYNNETLTLSALVTRFRRSGIKNPTLEAKKYLMQS